MRKPAYYRRNTWDEIVRQLEKRSLDDLVELLPSQEKEHSRGARERSVIISRLVASRGRLLGKLGMLTHFDYLTDTVVGLTDDVEYLLDSSAAEQMLANAGNITVVRLFDGHKKIIPRSDLLQALEASQNFDQLES